MNKQGYLGIALGLHNVMSTLSNDFVLAFKLE